MKQILFLLPCLTISLSAADQTGAESTKKPVSAAILAEKDSQQGDKPIGNVQVTYADGTTDLWTTKKDCGLARVSADGTVGWVIFEPETQVAASYNLRPCRTIALCRKGKIVTRITSGTPFINDWQFQDNGTRIAVAAMFTHGKTYYNLFDSTTGKSLASATATDEVIPEWAKPLHQED